MKYIFVVGAPGSKWSSVVKNIYYSSSIDRSDYREERTYYHDAGNPGHPELMHLGAYFDPGMEFGGFFHRLCEHDHYQCEAEFDAPFSDTGVKIIKSHVFAKHIDYLKATWPECPVVLVHRSDDSCLGWWVKCGHFDITYPKYDHYYKDLKTMSGIIKQQNEGILKAWWQYPDSPAIDDNHQLAQALGIELPPAQYQQYYAASDIRVKVI